MAQLKDLEVKLKAVVTVTWMSLLYLIILSTLAAFSAGVYYGRIIEYDRIHGDTK